MVKSPRWLRPHTIKVVNVLDEADYEQQTSETTVSRVKVAQQRSATYGSTGTSNSDTISITIDLNDYSSDKSYVTPDNYTDQETQFTLRAGDRVEVWGDYYEITSVSYVNPLRNTPEFLEVTAQ